MTTKDFAPTCPIPIAQYPQVLLAHGGGGRLMHSLIDKLYAPTFDHLEAQHDGAVLPLGDARMAFTTDSYVVRPLFFPGGDIGQMAVHGTVNDLAMCGARPLYISTSLILEEGLPMETLWQVVQSMQSAAAAAGVHIVTGDTKVVDKGKGDGVFINTAGIGIIEHDLNIGPRSIRAGDAIILSGDIGRHGIAIMASREGLSFESDIESDLAPVADLVMNLLDAGIEVHCLRDLTRGGLATALVEIAQSSNLQLQIEEAAIQVREDVRGACEILGFDPMYVANEGRFVAIIAADDVQRALDLFHQHPLGCDATLLGRVTDQRTGRVTMTSLIGANRIVDMLSGEQLPRIC
ncbi:MAG: hydrogenase expression/formation protein HypE [Anaerolineaceae bacterium]|nr:hydrogenase expression/formation protein HypE [Anaerolineaceae bacterium]